MRKYVFIVSISSDKSTDDVIDWISYLGHKPVRFNVDVDFKNNEWLLYLNFGKLINFSKLKLDGEEYQINDFHSIWFRKFLMPNFLDDYLGGITYNQMGDMINHVSNEYRFGLYALFSCWRENKRVLGGKIAKQPTKMEMLIYAKELDINIPNTLITNDKKELFEFISVNKKVITKPIKEGGIFNKVNLDSKKVSASMYTESLNENIIRKIPERFFMSMFQEQLNKELEIRTFYIGGKCYSTAIFSQMDSQTDVDFRMYNDQKPNRMTPYKLPYEFEKKVQLLMKKLDLITGSLDFVKTKDGEIYFLEVNPWGQYGMVSKNGNYNLDKKIAEYLIE